MRIKVLAFGIAKDIIEGSTTELDLEEGRNVGNLKDALCQRFPEFTKLKSLSIAVNANYQDDQYVLQENDEVVIIPPVSGG